MFCSYIMLKMNVAINGIGVERYQNKCVLSLFVKMWLNQGVGQLHMCTLKR